MSQYCIRENTAFNMDLRIEVIKPGSYEFKEFAKKKKTKKKKKRVGAGVLM